jgi:hypothetical protein
MECRGYKKALACLQSLPTNDPRCCGVISAAQEQAEAAIDDYEQGGKSCGDVN